MPRRLLAVVGCLIGAVLLGPAVAGGATTAEAAARTGVSPRAASNVVLIGVPGLKWADLSATRSPVLWGLAREGAIASLSVRTIGPWICPLDGWLTLSAGSRAAYPRVPCGQVPGTVQRTGRTWRAPMVEEARRITMRSNFRSAVGTLGDAAHRAGAGIAAIGPGAAAAARRGRDGEAIMAAVVRTARLGLIPPTSVQGVNT